MITRFLRFPGGKTKALTFSYDDGIDHDIRLIEIFRKYGMRATFNLNSGMFSPEGETHPENKNFWRMTERMVRQTYTPDVCEVACHSHTHPFLTTCDSGVACYEIIQDRKHLEDLFQTQVHGMAYPYGPTNDQLVEILKSCGIYYSRTGESTLKFDMPSNWLRLPATCHHKNPKLMELADQFLEMKPTRAPRLFYVWGHSYEFPAQDNWHVIEHFCEKMAGKDDIWYATNMEIYQAQQDFDRLESSVDGSMIYNPNVRPVWLADKKNNLYKIDPGETLRT